MTTTTTGRWARIDDRLSRNLFEKGNAPTLPPLGRGTPQRPWSPGFIQAALADCRRQRREQFVRAAAHAALGGLLIEVAISDARDAGPGAGDLWAGVPAIGPMLEIAWMVLMLINGLVQIAVAITCLGRAGQCRDHAERVRAQGERPMGLFLRDAQHREPRRPSWKMQATWDLSPDEQLWGQYACRAVPVAGSWSRRRAIDAQVLLTTERVLLATAYGITSSTWSDLDHLNWWEEGSASRLQARRRVPDRFETTAVIDVVLEPRVAVTAISGALVAYADATSQREQYRKDLLRHGVIRYLSAHASSDDLYLSPSTGGSMHALFGTSDVDVARQRLVAANPSMPRAALDAIIELVRAEALGVVNPDLDTPGTVIVLRELTDEEADQLASAQREALSASPRGPVQ